MPLEYLKETPSQTGGPYVHMGTLPARAGIAIGYGDNLNRIEAPGERIRVAGTIADGAGGLLRDGIIELWQADAEGRLGAHGLWGRTAPDFATGEWAFETVRPGPVDGGVPFLTFLVFARGINIHLHTRMYFPEDSARHPGDAVLKRIDPRRRGTLVAAATGNAGYRFDIRLQGEGETVFFDI
jgi:protocatechuate 3,4-dioxygenase alpha subunit